MKAIVQRVTHAEVVVADACVGRIGPGLLVLIGVRTGDTQSDAVALANRLAQLRIFRDDADRMNRSVRDTGGSVLMISQFTLYADTRGGHRPGFSRAAPATLAEPLYQHVIATLRHVLGDDRVHHGVFGATMQVTLCNDGPVTIELDTDPVPCGL